jgi:hypothetical protein
MDAIREREVTRTRVRASLVLVLAVTVGLGARQVWRSEQERVQQRARRAAAESLATMALPPELTRGSDLQMCAHAVDTICATSASTPSSLEQTLVRLLDGSIDDQSCKILPPPTGSPCPVVVVGTVAGHPAMGIAEPRLIRVDSGKPSAGAVPVKPGSASPLYWSGSEIAIGLLDAPD